MPSRSGYPQPHSSPISVALLSVLHRLQADWRPTPGPHPPPSTPWSIHHSRPPPLLFSFWPRCSLGPLGFLGAWPPRSAWKCSLPHLSFPTLESRPPDRTAPGTAPAACCIAAQPSVREGRNLQPPPPAPTTPAQQPPAPARPALRRTHLSQLKAPLPEQKRRSLLTVPLLTFRAQKCGPGSPLVARGGATDSWLVSEEFRLSDSTAP